MHFSLQCPFFCNGFVLDVCVNLTSVTGKLERRDSEYVGELKLSSLKLTDVSGVSEWNKCADFYQSRFRKSVMGSLGI